jgi:hypothetical protein
MTIEQLIGNDGSDVDEDNFLKVFGQLGEGVFGSVANECEVIESAPAAMTVEVRTGTLVTGGVFGRVSAQDVLVIAAADPVNPRIDRVVARRDNATNLWSLAIVAGTPAGAPVPTALTRNGTYEISLAQVLVGAAVVQINTADITDERHDRAVCGWVTYGGRRQAVEILDRDLTQVEWVSDLTERSIYSHVIPRATLGATGGIRLSLGGDYLNNDGVNRTLRIRIKLGATTVFDREFQIVTNAQRRKWFLKLWFMNSAAAAQKWSVDWYLSAGIADALAIGTSGGELGAKGGGYEASAEDTADALTLDVTTQHNVNSAQVSIRKEMAVLELLPA